MDGGARLGVWVSIVMGLAVSTTGCSGGDGGGTAGTNPAGQATAADAALADTTCYLGLEVPGVDHSGGVGCSGTDTMTTVTGLAKNSFDDALNVTFELNAPPALGPLDVSALTIDVPVDGQSRLWDAPVSACNVTAVDSSFDDFFSWTYFRIDVDCTEPATPQASNPGAPLQVGDFIAVSFFTLQ